MPNVRHGINTMPWRDFFVCFYSILNRKWPSILLTSQVRQTSRSIAPPSLHTVRAPLIAGASYCSTNHAVEQWTCDPCKNHKNIKATSVTKRSRFFVFNSFVAHDPLINWIILAIAGTGLFLWAIDLRSIDLGFITHAPLRVTLRSHVFCFTRPFQIPRPFDRSAHQEGWHSTTCEHR